MKEEEEEADVNLDLTVRGISIVLYPCPFLLVVGVAESPFMIRNNQLES